MAACKIDDCECSHCITCGCCLPYHYGPPITCEGCDIQEESAEFDAMTEAERESHHRAVWAAAEAGLFD